MSYVVDRANPGFLLELQLQYSNYKNNLQQIAQKIGDVEQETEEHKYAISLSLSPNFLFSPPPKARGPLRSSSRPVPKIPTLLTACSPPFCQSQTCPRNPRSAAGRTEVLPDDQRCASRTDRGGCHACVENKLGRAEEGPG